MKSQLKHTFKTALFNFISSNREIYIIGDGRSGTTWASDILNFDNKLTGVFEPFHGRRCLELSEGRLYPTNADLDIRQTKKTLKDLVCDKMERPRGISVSGILIKDISSHLILSKLKDGQNNIVIILRNPLSVSISKERYGTWHNKRDLQVLLSQSHQLRAIEKSCLDKNLISNSFLEFVFAWCVLHRIALPSALELDIPIVFYENLLREPEEAIKNLFFKVDYGHHFRRNREKILSSAKNRSRTSTKHNNIQRNMANDQPWIGLKSESEVSKAFQILKEFDLYKIYEDSLQPKISQAAIYDLAKTWSYVCST